MIVYILWATTSSFSSSDFILDIYSSYAAAYEEKRRLEASGNGAYKYSIEEREVIGGEQV